MDTNVYKQQALAIRDHFSQYGQVNKPASEVQIARAEKQIDTRLPPILRALYELCNGFYGPVTAPYLAPLHGNSFSLVKATNYFRETSDQDTVGFVCFGRDAADNYWAMRDIGSGLVEIILSYSESTEFREEGHDLLQVYLKDELECKRDLGEL